MILRRYMTQQLATTTALVLGFLVVLLLGGRVIRYFGIAAEGKLDVSLLFSIIGYNLPYFLELILPLAFFISLMLVFGRLYVDHEMAVLNSSGISRGQLARMAIPLILILFIAEAGLSLFGKPWGVRQAENVWTKQALSSAFDMISPQTFVNSGDYSFYVGGISDDKNELQDVIVVKTNETGKDTVILAKRAVKVEGGTTQLDLYQGRRYSVSATSKAYSQVSFERYRISIEQPVNEIAGELPIEIQPLPIVWRFAKAEPVTLPVSTGLTDATADPNEPRQDTAAPTENIIVPTPQQILLAQAELGYRLAMPWLMIIAPMLAVPLAQVRPRQGRWMRLLPSILLFASCALILVSLKKPVSKGHLSAWIYALAVVLFMTLALFLNWSSRINNRIRFGFNQPKLAGNATTLNQIMTADNVPDTNAKDKQDGGVR